jgi:hypothetical protein
MPNVVVVIGAGQIGQAIARRVGVGKHVVLAEGSEANANAAAEVMGNAGYQVSVATVATVDVSSRPAVHALVGKPQEATIPNAQPTFYDNITIAGGPAPARQRRIIRRSGFARLMLLQRSLLRTFAVHRTSIAPRFAATCVIRTAISSKWGRADDVHTHTPGPLQVIR